MNYRLVVRIFFFFKHVKEEMCIRAWRPKGYAPHPVPNRAEISLLGASFVPEPRGRGRDSMFDNLLQSNAKKFAFIARVLETLLRTKDLQTMRFHFTGISSDCL